MPKKNILFGISGLLFTILGFVAKGFFREYIRVHGWDDAGISGWLPSFLYVIGFSQLLLMRTAAYPNATIFIVMFASVLFEILQYHQTEMVDIPDIFASVTGGLVSFLIYRGIEKRIK